MTERYEYKVETKKRLMLAGQQYSEEAMCADLNEFGKDGWELCMIASAAAGSMMHVQFILKRKIVETMQ